VRLVVLSACRAVRPGGGRAEGFAGLSGALLAAGAGGVVGSTGQVDDVTTQALMVAFHRAWRRSGDGAAALREAQLQLLRSPDPTLPPRPCGGRFDTRVPDPTLHPEETMALDLEIRFHGLCLFVPADGSMNVLMPAAGVPGRVPGMPEHVAVLCFDPAYLSRGSRRTRLVTLVSLMRHQLVIRGKGPAERLSLPDTLARVGAVARRPVTPAAFSPDPAAGLLTARIELHSGLCTGTGPTQCFRYPADTRPRPLTSMIEWTLPVEEDYVDLVPEPFPGADREVIPRLHPIDRRIRLSVYHTARPELPPVAERGSDGPQMHFRALYHLFEAPVPDEAVPVPDPDPLCPGQGELPYTCMGPGQSVLDPE
jgi:hypothetical protein